MNRLHWKGRDHPRDEVDAMVQAGCSLLQNIGVGRGDRLGLLAHDSPLFVATVMACREIGAVVIPLSPSLPEPGLSARLDQVPLDGLVAQKDQVSRAKKIAPGLPMVSGELDASNWSLVQEKEIERKPGSAGEDARAVLFSSGTTGGPGAWVYTESALSAHAQAAVRRLSQNRRSVVLGVLPLHHAGGFMLLDRVLRSGGALVLESSFDAGQAVRALEERSVTHVSLVPLMFQRILARQETPPSGLRSVLLGGDRTDPELLRRGCNAGWPVQPSYGLTESCSQAVTATPEEACSSPGTVGRPLSGVRVWIRRPDGKRAGAGEEGEIMIEGSTLARALGDERAVKSLCTGDRGRLDAEGRLFVTGRSLHRIVTGGNTVDALQVEDVLETSPLVAAACVVGLPDEQWGQRVAALVEPAGELDEKILMAHARKRLPDPAVPREWRLVEGLPRTLVGKKDRAAAVAAFSAERSALSG